MATLGDSVTEMVCSIQAGGSPTLSQRTSMMVFGAKPKKSSSILPKDKCRISLLNSDFKIASGLEAKHLNSVSTHALSHLQLVAGNDRRIHHGINLARDAIYAANSRNNIGCGILDTDLISAFCNMILLWCLKVLKKKVFRIIY